MLFEALLAMRFEPHKQVSASLLVVDFQDGLPWRDQFLFNFSTLLLSRNAQNGKILPDHIFIIRCEMLIMETNQRGSRNVDQAMNPCRSKITSQMISKIFFGSNILLVAEVKFSLEIFDLASVNVTWNQLYICICISQTKIHWPSKHRCMGNKKFFSSLSEKLVSFIFPWKYKIWNKYVPWRRA